MSSLGLKFVVNLILVYGILCPYKPVYAQDGNDEKDFEICRTPECNLSASLLSRSIDSDINPCDNFYEYACGKLLKDTTIPEGWDSVNIVKTVLMKMKHKIIEYLKTKTPEDPDVVKKAKSFFASCTSEAEIENLGLVPLTIVMRTLNLPMRPPYLGTLEMKDDLSTLIGKMRQIIYINFPFQLNIGPDPADKNKFRLELQLPISGENSKLPFWPKPNQPSDQPSNTVSQRENKSAIPTEIDDSKEKNPAAPAAIKLVRKGTRKKSFKLATRALEKTPTAEKKPVTKRKKTKKSATNSNDKDKKVGKPKTPRKEVPSKKPFPENSSSNKRTPEKSAAKNLEERKPDESEENKEKKEVEETKKVEEKEKVNDQANEVQDNEGELGKNDEPSTPLEITDDENQPLIHYMIQVANVLYQHTNVKLLEGKSELLREKVTEVSKIFHELEKITVKAHKSEKNGKEMTIKELQELTDSFDTKTDKNPVINWSTLIGTLFSFNPSMKTQFEQGRKIYIQDMNYLESMLKFLYDTNPRSLYCALWWHMVRIYISDLKADLRALESSYRKQAKIPDKSREEYCLLVTARTYGFPTVYNYISDKFTKRNKKTVRELFKYFYGQLVSMIRSSTILDTKTIMASIARFDSGNYSFGFPNSFEEIEFLNNMFGTVIFHENNYFFSQFFEIRDSIRQEFEFLDKSFFFGVIDPFAEDSVINVQENFRMIPLVYTQFPFVGNGLMSLTFGALIMPFFRQAFHHFDALGNEYNLWGKKERWWTKKVMNKYLSQAECYVTAYNKECFGDLGCVDGKRTLHENIADSAALKATIEAYKTYKKNVNSEPKLINFESLSHLKLLTLSFAISMCQVQTPQKLYEILKTDKYPPPSVRINQVMKNSKHFAEIWGCDKGTPMNPNQDKCELW